ncbi:MAG: glycosyltransferase family 39 protein [Ruminococcus sp.]|nr:glycosyltransferase family 39 protein [Ruminococcus sp.]
MNRKNLTETIIKSISAHPYLFTLGICLLINPFFLGATYNIPSNALWIETFIITALIFIFGYYRYKTDSLNKSGFIIFTVSAVIADLSASSLYATSENKALWHFTGGYVILFILYCLADTKKYRTQLNSLLITGTGFFLKMYYVLQTSVYTRQHDLGSFGSDEGHAGYIEYLLFNHNIADFDVRDRWQFYHPPLHHAISALWIYINENILLTGRDPARESLQTLTLFYSMCIIISAYRILRYFKLNGKSLYIPLIIISFHPAFTLLSGSINNDVLSVAFMLGAVITTLKWYENQTIKNILKIAVCIGLGMMTKLSAALIAPPVAVVFLIVFIKKIRTDGKKLFIQFCAFAGVCCPLGLWYGIRNYIRWKIPVTYVQELDKGMLQYIGNQSFLSRITDFSSEQFRSVFIQWAYEENGEVMGYNEYNPLVAILKNSLFEEGGFFPADSFMNKLSVIFFIVSTIIALYAFIAMIVMFFRKCKINTTEKIFFAVFYLTMMINFYKMCHDYPFTCTMNFRYITPTVITGALFIGIISDKMISHKTRTAEIMIYITEVMTLLFAVLTIIIYLAVGCLPE